MKKLLRKIGEILCLLLAGAAVPGSATAAENYYHLAPDGVWCWFGNPRAIQKDGKIYFGYVRYADGRVCLNAFDPAAAQSSLLWASDMTERDDHDNPGLLELNDGRMLAIYAKHGGERKFYYRVTRDTNTASPASWSPELVFTNTTAGVTYANPYQLAAETNRIINFMRNLNFNPTITISDASGTNWSAPQQFIKTGTGGYRPYVQYCSDYQSRIDVTYTDGHPDVAAVPTSLYHLYYQGEAFYKSDGTFLKSLQDLPILHDSPYLERGTVVYQYSAAPSSDPNQHIQHGRAWSWDVAYHTNGLPVTAFSVQVTNVMGGNWYDDRIYYYYARWTGTAWQKRFIAHAGRPLYNTQRYYAGGISIDSNNPDVVYLASNAADPFNVAITRPVALKANDRYEIYRGQTFDGGLTFTWQAVTTNSIVDNLRPVVPRQNTFPYGVIWYAGVYTSYTKWDTAVYGIFTNYLAPVTIVPNRTPEIAVVSPAGSPIQMPDTANYLELRAIVTDDQVSGPLTARWLNLSGPAAAVFVDETATNTSVRFASSGIYRLGLRADDSVYTNTATVTVIAGGLASPVSDPSLTLWLKLDETSGTTAYDSSASNYHGTVVGNASWTSDGRRGGAILLNPTNSHVEVPDAPGLDNTSALTLAFWVKAFSYKSGGSGLVSKRITLSDNNAYTTFLQSDGLVNVDLDGNSSRFTSTSVLALGKWYHVAVTFDGSQTTNQRARIYINGVLERTAAENSPAIPNYSSSLKIGLTHTGATTYLDGVMDDVRIYRRALTGDEIAALAAYGIAPAIQVGPVPALTNRVPGSLTASVAPGDPGVPLSAGWSPRSGPATPAFDTPASASTTVTFTKAGDYELMVSAANPSARVWAPVAAHVWPNENVFEDWVMASLPGSPDPADLAPNADPDLDQAVNFVEFALGLNPGLPDNQISGPSQPGRPQVQLAPDAGGDYLTMMVRRPIGRLGITWLVEVSNLAADWSAAVPALQIGQPEDNGDNSETVRFRDPSPAGNSSARFIRLRVQAME